MLVVTNVENRITKFRLFPMPRRYEKLTWKFLWSYCRGLLMRETDYSNAQQFKEITQWSNTNSLYLLVKSNVQIHFHRMHRKGTEHPYQQWMLGFMDIHVSLFTYEIDEIEIMNITFSLCSRVPCWLTLLWRLQQTQLCSEYMESPHLFVIEKPIFVVSLPMSHDLQIHRRHINFRIKTASIDMKVTNKSVLRESQKKLSQEWFRK